MERDTPLKMFKHYIKISENYYICNDHRHQQGVQEDSGIYTIFLSS